MTVRPFILSAIAAAAMAGVQQVSRPARVGMNIPQENPLSRSHMYVDVLRSANGWGLPDGNWIDPSTMDPPRGPIAVNVDGWPTEDFSVLLMQAQKTTPNIAGTYTIVFDGPAGVSIYGQTAEFAVSTPVLDVPSGKWVASAVFNPDIAPEAEGTAILVVTNTQGLVRNLKVIRPGYDWRSHPTFTDHWMAYCENFSVIRFMDWTLANFGHELGDWDLRSTPADTRAGTWGLNSWKEAVRRMGARSWEEVIEMANATQCHLWINIPVSADATYVSNLAALVAASLNPSLKVYLELGNELWNNMFGQTHASRLILRDDVATWDAPAKALLQDDYFSVDPYDPETTSGQANMMLRWSAHRLRGYASTFRTAMSESVVKTRVLPVLAWQQNSLPFYGEDAINYLRNAYPSELASDWCHAIAGAPYLHMGDPNGAEPHPWLVDGLTADQVLDALEAWLPSLPTLYSYSRSYITALSAGLEWITYEAGVDTVGNASAAAKGGSTRLPRMKTIQRAFIDQLQSYGCGVWMQYTGGAGNVNGGGYTWPAEEWLTDVPHVPGPKQAALNEAGAAPWPAQVTRLKTSEAPWDAGQYEENPFKDNTSHASYPEQLTWAQSNTTRTYFINIEVAGVYDLSITTTALFDPINVWSAKIGSTVVADHVNTTDGTGVTTVIASSLDLPVGPILLRVTHHNAVEGGTPRTSYGLTMTSIDLSAA